MKIGTYYRRIFYPKNFSESLFY